jgi:thiol peroxidase
MSRSVTFKGDPKTLVGDQVEVGQPAPDFELTNGSMETVTVQDLKGKPTLISVVPSLDTPVCQTQTKRFNEEIASLGDQVHAFTVSLDLPFAQGRFCTSEGVENMQSLSDYKDRSFGTNWGMLIDELKLLARGVFVLDADGNVVHAETVGEVVDEPDYATALEALKGQL